MPLYFFYTMVQKSKGPKTQIKVDPALKLLLFKKKKKKERKKEGKWVTTILKSVQKP